MKMFRDLSVFCERDSLDSLMSQIETSLTHRWSRDRIWEAQYAPPYGEPIFCFARPSNGECPAVALMICATQHGAKVANIVPDDGELSRDHYNSILTEFYLRFFQTAAAKNNFTTELSSDVLDIEIGLGAKAARLLKAFSDTANKSAVHPAARGLWFAFLISLHDRPDRDRFPALFANWLFKGGWSRDDVSKLVCEWEFARDLLSAYDEHRFTSSQTSASSLPTLSPGDFGIEEAFGSTALRLLRRFSLLANKSQTHPSDSQRWFAFLICLHDRPTDDHQADLVKDWLLKDGWSENRATALVSELEFGRGLLRSYDHLRSG
jgi:hypothetical protein